MQMTPRPPSPWLFRGVFAAIALAFALMLPAVALPALLPLAIVSGFILWNWKTWDALRPMVGRCSAAESKNRQWQAMIHISAHRFGDADEVLGTKLGLTIEYPCKLVRVMILFGCGLAFLAVVMMPSGSWFTLWLRLLALHEVLLQSGLMLANKYELYAKSRAVRSTDST